jgi:putative SOS response-associated peptidase YedK
MGIAGIYRKYSGPDGREMFAFSMLTVNADDHPFMRRFHAPDDEKRMVVILEPEDFEQWLTCPVAEAKERFCKQWHGELVGDPPCVRLVVASKDFSFRSSDNNETEIFRSIY